METSAKWDNEVYTKVGSCYEIDFNEGELALSGTGFWT